MEEINEKITGIEPSQEPKSNESAEPVQNAELPEGATQEVSECPSEPEPQKEPEKPLWSFSEQLRADRESARAGGRRGALVYASVMTALFAVCFGILALLLITGFGNESDNREPVIPSAENAADLVESVIDGVVTVSVSLENGKGFGSGFVYTDDGYIITNYHVVDDATSITVICHDGSEFPAEYIDGDELNDIAVIRVRGLNIPKLNVGNSDALRAGEGVVAIGTPIDIQYAGTVTKGIVSGIKREVLIYDDQDRLEKKMSLIQTDAVLNHGNSGGPLFNMAGEVIGINTLKHLNLENGDEMGFAVPINDAIEIADDIIEDGEYSGGKGSAAEGVKLGIQCKAVRKGVRTEVDNFGNTYVPEADGILVISIEKDSVCDGKLENNDIIMTFDGVILTDSEQMRALLYEHKKGDKVILSVFRDGKTVEVELVL